MACPHKDKNCPLEFKYKDEGRCSRCGEALKAIKPAFPIWKAVLFSLVGLLVCGGVYYGYSRKNAVLTSDLYKDTDVILKLAGSSTMGRHLVPDLAKAYLEKQLNATDVTINND